MLMDSVGPEYKQYRARNDPSLLYDVTAVETWGVVYDVMWQLGAKIIWGLPLLSIFT